MVKKYLFCAKFFWEKRRFFMYNNTSDEIFHVISIIEYDIKIYMCEVVGAVQSV